MKISLKLALVYFCYFISGNGLFIYFLLTVIILIYTGKENALPQRTMVQSQET